tara:strand:- start:383 stop:865 length:483 start_codon:yes stop_codon:yes gene_type:complete
MTKAVYGGKEKRFKTPQDLAKKLDAYKAYVKEQQLTNEKFTPTILGFAEHCNILYAELPNWMNDPTFKDYHEEIKKVYQFCEQGLIENALCNKANPIFSMFLLKCKHNYIDKQVIEQTTTHNFSLRNLHADMSKLATVEEVKPQQLEAKEQKEGSISDEV